MKKLTLYKTLIRNSIWNEDRLVKSTKNILIFVSQKRQSVFMRKFNTTPLSSQFYHLSPCVISGIIRLAIGIRSGTISIVITFTKY